MSTGNLSFLRASLFNGNFSSSTAPVTSRDITSYIKVLYSAWWVTFEESNGQLICNHITNILGHIGVEKPGSQSLQHGVQLARGLGISDGGSSQRYYYGRCRSICQHFYTSCCFLVKVVTQIKSECKGLQPRFQAARKQQKQGGRSLS